MKGDKGTIKLFELRSEKGLSQRDMAKLFNISQGTYNNWENSNTQPSIEQLIALAEYFDVTVDYLVGKPTDYSNTQKNSLPRVRIDKANFLKLFSEANDETKSAIVILLQNSSKNNESEF